MKTIRASEIGSYLFCARAWWYRQKGFASTNQGEMATGSELHEAHGRRVLAAGLTRTLASLLLLLSLALLAAYCTLQVI